MTVSDYDLKRAIVEAYTARPNLPDYFTWVAADGSCPYCKGTLERTSGNLFRWNSGLFRCTSCTYKSGFMGHVARSILQVEPLPPGATPIYYSETAMNDEENDINQNPPHSCSDFAPPKKVEEGEHEEAASSDEEKTIG